MTNKMQLCRQIYYSLADLHISSDIFAYHQEYLNCITASGITHVCRCRQVAITVWQIQDAVDTVVCAPDDGWRYYPKDVEQFPDKINRVTLHLVRYILEYSYDARTCAYYLCTEISISLRSILFEHWAQNYVFSHLRHKSLANYIVHVWSS